jgi:hypothetical protein
MSATMCKTISTLAAAALVSSYGDGSYGQPAEFGHGGTIASTDEPANPEPRATHPGLQARGLVPAPTAESNNPAWALSVQTNGDKPPRLGAGPHWHGDIEEFSEHDLLVWQGGHWRQGVHDGRLGWWWIVDGVWYLYPSPVYPYPDPFAPPFLASPPPGVTYWYYCQSYEQYYPYVPTCPGGWRAVPAAHEPAGPGARP